MKLRTLIVAAVLAFAASPAAAVVTQLTFTPAGGPQSPVHFSGYEPGTTIIDNELTAKLSMNLVDVSANGYEWQFSYTLRNTSTDISRLSVLGMDVAPSFESVKDVNGMFDTSAAGNMASLGGRAFCLKDGGGSNNCSGGGSGGLTAGQVGSGIFTLVFQSQSTTFTYTQVPKYNKHGKITGYTQVATPVVTVVPAPTQVVFKNFGIRLQSLANGGSTVGVPTDRYSPPPGGGGLGGAAIPEPATWTMLIVGFGAAGAALRRRRTAAA